MIDYNAYRRKIASLVDTENREEKNAAAMAKLSMEILEQFIRLTNGFSLMEAPALIAALDRYKSILLDTMNEDRMDIQKLADEVNRLTQVDFVCVKERSDSDAECRSASWPTSTPARKQRSARCWASKKRLVHPRRPRKNLPQSGP